MDKRTPSPPQRQGRRAVGVSDLQVEQRVEADPLQPLLLGGAWIYSGTLSLQAKQHSLVSSPDPHGCAARLQREVSAVQIRWAGHYRARWQKVRRALICEETSSLTHTCTRSLDLCRQRSDNRSAPRHRSLTRTPWPCPPQIRVDAIPERQLEAHHFKRREAHGRAQLAQIWFRARQSYRHLGAALVTTSLSRACQCWSWG